MLSVPRTPLNARRARRRANPLVGEAGFTLIELLVVMLAGMIVLGALFTMTDVTLRQTTLTFSRVDATQQGRLAVQRLETELHSACVAAGLAPIQTGSTGTSLIFISQYGSTASAVNAITPTPVEHVVAYNSAAGTLTDTTYPVSGGTGPVWTFASTPQGTTVLLAHVSLQSGNPPMFQYFAYSTPVNGGSPYTAPDGSNVEMIQDGVNTVPYYPSATPAAAPLTTPLSASDAQNTVEVLIRFVAGPNGGTDENTNKAGDSTTDQVVLRLTQAQNHVANGATFGPCQ